MRKVLILTYYWPPGSGAGVQRWLKFTKYLPEYNWEPVILTVDPDYATYPATDSSLSAEIPAGLKIYRTKATDFFRLYSSDKSKIPSAGFAMDEKKGIFTWLSKFARGNFFIPDPRKGWNKYAYAKACQLIQTLNIENIITTSPPHSTQLIGIRLKKRYPRIRWIADLRDPWTDIYYYNQFHPSFISRSLDLRYERKVLLSADSIITVGNSLRELFASKAPAIGEKIDVITNGYDPEDFRNKITKNPSVFTISYIGTLSAPYPLNGFLASLETFAKYNADFKLRFVGMVSGEQKEKILAGVDRSKTEFIAYVNHNRAVDYLLDSTALLLIIPDHRSNKSIVSGKLFEYLAACKPIICMGPAEGDAAAIIQESGHGRTFGYNDSEGVSEYLRSLIQSPEIDDKTAPAEYSREMLVKKVARLLT
jgi:glycosyltransferase involved in cell wall biosynthesis